MAHVLLRAGSGNTVRARKLQLRMLVAPLGLARRRCALALGRSSCAAAFGAERRARDRRNCFIAFGPVPMTCLVEFALVHCARLRALVFVARRGAILCKCFLLCASSSRRCLILFCFALDVSRVRPRTSFISIESRA